MLKGLLKIFLGDKSSSDLKEIQPIVDDILIAEKELLSISADELRAKTSLLRSRITDFVSELQNEIDTLLRTGCIYARVKPRRERSRFCSSR